MKTILKCFIIFVLLIVKISCQDLSEILGKCHKKSSNFDTCMRDAFNELRVFFKSGIPEYNIKPFDPHHSSYIELRRGDATFIGGFRLLLKDVSEYGWINSNVTKYRTDSENNRFVYSQYFPEKSLDGLYDFTIKILGVPFHTKGFWNLTLYDYSQTTSVTRVSGPDSLIKIRVEIDKVGGLSLHITDIFSGKKVLEFLADFLINNMWQIGFPFIKPLINELVSTAFTDIFNESFRYFPIDKFIFD